MIYQQKFKKRAIALFVMCFILLTAKAQQDSVTNLPNFLFPSFTKCFIKFKNGELKTAIVNYNVVDEELVFIQDNAYMTLENPEAVIDTLYVGGRVFMPFNTNAFYELFSTGAINLFMQYKKDAELVGTTTAYGVKSQAANATYRKQIYGSATGNVDLSVPSQFKLTENNSYWIKKEGNMHKFTSKRQFLKICKDKDDEISKFLNTHTIHFNNISNLKELVNYCNDTVYKQ